MRIWTVPALDARYWIAITVASIFGANLGDFCSHTLGLGHWRGLPPLVAAFLLLVLWARRGPASEAFYWAAIVVLRTAATNLGDLASHDLKLDDTALIGVLALGLAVLAPLGGRRAAAATGALVADGLYWLTMLTAGTLGTVLGDWCAHRVGLGVSALLWLPVWAAALAIQLHLRSAAAIAYWTTIAVIRTLGTNLGDLLAGRHGLALGLPAATTLSGLAFVGVPLLWRPAPASARMIGTRA